MVTETCVGSKCFSVICGYLAVLVSVQLLPLLHGKSLQQGGALTHMLTQIQALLLMVASQVVFFFFFSLVTKRVSAQCQVFQRGFS